MYKQIMTAVTLTAVLFTADARAECACASKKNTTTINQTGSGESNTFPLGKMPGQSGV